MSTTTKPTQPRAYRVQAQPGRSRVFVGVRVAAPNAAKLRQHAVTNYGGNVSAAVEALIEGSKTAPATPSTGHHRGRHRTSPEGRHAAK
jgi:hypothetical protein